MLKWLFDMAAGRLATDKDVDDDRYEISGNDETMMVDLILYEVESIVFAFETERELRKSRECLRNRVPDYSWLVTDISRKPKKYLTPALDSSITGFYHRVGEITINLDSGTESTAKSLRAYPPRRVVEAHQSLENSFTSMPIGFLFSLKIDGLQFFESAAG
ncbi:unnamed protein product [Angiostrongylus costaricensis]|uniref:BRCT domain-containing protein n=1 Tax=Angiostrongylus costaricensis TaxID=334426 RepID=A0A158PI56_ANGCS|nr:unnamed protein product [Angiostrongylus costaricensis]